MADDEVELVQRCLRGDPRAIKDLVERFQADVYGLCVRILHHHQDAEDATQEIFVRIFRSLARWDAARTLRPWIMGITLNRCRTWLTQRARRLKTTSFRLEDVARPPDEPAHELVREIEAAVSDLRPDYRSVFLLFHQHGQGYDEISLAMDRPVGTIKTWLHRARLAILERLRQRGMVPENSGE
ncbi:MAG TPA: RNA polymerase sigma factor [Gemmataceae bacterium]|nr:RNA polymerase sigma factor [Gemmataceae bacterium]